MLLARQALLLLELSSLPQNKLMIWKGQLARKELKNSESLGDSKTQIKPQKLVKKIQRSKFVQMYVHILT